MSKTEAEAFLETYHALEDTKIKLVDYANQIAGRELSGRQLRVAFLLLKVLAHTDTLLNIIQNNFQYRIDKRKWFRFRKTRFFPFDHYSICALGRVSFDAGLMLHYVSEPSLTLPEWNLRRKILYLHDLSNRSRFMKSAGKFIGDASVDDGDYKFFREGIKQDILAHLKELNIEPNPDFTSGQMVFVEGMRGAVREAGWSIDRFAFQQVYLSNFIHTHPVSFMRADEHRISFENPSAAQFSASLVAVETANDSARASLNRCRLFLAMGGDPLAEYFDESGMQVGTKLNL